MSHVSVTYLNNNAVASFQRGHHEDAVTGLKVAINHLLRKLTTDEIPASSPTRCSSYEPATSTPGTDKQSLDFTIHHNSFARQVDQDDTAMSFYWDTFFPIPIDAPMLPGGREPQNASSMYRCAIILSDDHEDLTTDNNVNETSVAVLYNLAFMHHWRAVHLGISSGMSKAQQLYTMALKIIRPHDSLPDVENLELAIWNNLGHIHTQLFEVDQAIFCYSRLRGLMAQRADLLHFIPRQDYEIFLLSAMFQGSELHLAPAA